LTAVDRLSHSLLLTLLLTALHESDVLRDGRGAVRCPAGLPSVEGRKALSHRESAIAWVGTEASACDMDDVLANANIPDRHLGGRVLATELRDYGTVGPHDFAGTAQVGLIRRAAIIGGSACVIEPAVPDAALARYPRRSRTPTVRLFDARGRRSIPDATDAAGVVEVRRGGPESRSASIQTHNRTAVSSGWDRANLLEKSEQVSDLPAFRDASVLEAIDAHELSGELRVGGRNAIELPDVGPREPPATGNAIAALEDIVDVNAPVEGAVEDRPPCSEPLEPPRDLHGDMVVKEVVRDQISGVLRPVGVERLE
jgi:hypothetical protein